jgi:hypothetical protein
MQALWTDAIAPSEVCARLRRLMSQQLTRRRIASGFGPGFAVAAKSGGLMGIVRNEVGVVTDLHGMAHAVAVFTRRGKGGRRPSPCDAERPCGRTLACRSSAIGSAARRRDTH